VRHTTRNAVVGVVLCVLAVAALVVPVIGFAHSVSNDNSADLTMMLVGGGLGFLLGITGLALLAAVFLDGLTARREKRLEDAEPDE